MKTIRVVLNSAADINKLIDGLPQALNYEKSKQEGEFYIIVDAVNKFAIARIVEELSLTGLIYIED